MIPLHDENPTRTAPVVTYLIIAVNVLVFLWQFFGVGLEVSVFLAGLIPAELVQGADRVYGGRPVGLPPDVQVRNLEPAWATVFTSMFMHGGWLHIISNMWFLHIFGNNVEDSLGKVKYVLFYLACGVAAAAAQIALNPGSQIPMIGASGAVAGILGSYLVLFPGSRVTCITMTFVIMRIQLPAWIVLGLWFVIELVRGLTALGSDVGGVAYGAHVGGFVFGWIVIRFLGAERHPRPTRRPAGPEGMDWR